MKAAAAPTASAAPASTEAPDRAAGSGSAIVLFAHGARDPEWARPFERLRDMISRRRPEIAVALAYLEFMQPSLEAAVAALAGDGAAAVTVIPLFMAQGGHLKHDLPLIADDIRRQHPGVTLRVAPPIGDVDAILEAIAAWILQAHGQGSS